MGAHYPQCKLQFDTRTLHRHSEAGELTTSIAPLAIALISVGWGVVSSMMIVSRLRDRGIKINFFLLRILIIRYAAQYRAITREETGRTGPWFYSFVVAMNLALVCAVVGLVLH